MKEIEKNTHYSPAFVYTRVPTDYKRYETGREKDPVNELMEIILGASARFDSEMRSRRIKAGIANKRLREASLTNDNKIKKV